MSKTPPYLDPALIRALRAEQRAMFAYANRRQLREDRQLLRRILASPVEIAVPTSTEPLLESLPAGVMSLARQFRSSITWRLSSRIN